MSFPNPSCGFPPNFDLQSMMAYQQWQQGQQCGFPFQCHQQKKEHKHKEEDCSKSIILESSKCEDKKKITPGDLMVELQKLQHEISILSVLYPRGKNLSCINLSNQGVTGASVNSIVTASSFTENLFSALSSLPNGGTTTPTVVNGVLSFPRFSCFSFCSASPCTSGSYVYQVTFSKDVNGNITLTIPGLTTSLTIPPGADFVISLI